MALPDGSSGAHPEEVLKIGADVSESVLEWLHRTDPGDTGDPAAAASDPTGDSRRLGDDDIRPVGQLRVRLGLLTGMWR